VTDRRERAGFGFPDQRPHRRSNDDVQLAFSRRGYAAFLRETQRPHTRHDRSHIRKAENRMGDVGMTKVRGRAGRQPAGNAEAGSLEAGCLEQRVAVGSR
jgi:hypothetical protein